MVKGRIQGRVQMLANEPVNLQLQRRIHTFQFLNCVARLLEQFLLLLAETFGFLEPGLQLVDLLLLSFHLILQDLLALLTSHNVLFFFP